MIRQATKTDLFSIERMVHKMFLEAGDNFGHANRTSWTVDQIRSLIDRDEGIYVAGDPPKAFCALAHLDYMNDGECFGLGAYVDPSMRGSNLADQLRGAAEDHCKRKGYKSILGEVSTANRPALRSLLHRKGVKVIGLTLKKDLTSNDDESELDQWLQL